MKDSEGRMNLLTDHVWRRLTALANRRRRGPAFVAVPYVGEGANHRLQLRAGDLLVTRFDDAAFKSGVVDPKEIIKYLEQGVEVHQYASLHAKVYVLGDRVVVGSANLSTLSADHLVEAAVETIDMRVVAAARRFVASLRGDRIGIEYARRKVPLYRPPQFPKHLPRGRRSGSRVASSPLVVVRLDLVDYDETDERATVSAKEGARPRLAKPEQARIDTFRWTGAVPRGLRRDVLVIQCTRDGQRTMVAQPARVLDVWRYSGSRGVRRTIVSVEAPKGSRERSLGSLVRRLPAASILGRVASCREIRNGVLAFQLGQLWSGRGRPRAL